jgi:hypothetical protein
MKIERLMDTLSPFFQRFLFYSGPEGWDRKTSKYSPNELMAMNEDYDPVILYLPLLVIGCNWCGHGKMQDRLDS